MNSLFEPSSTLSVHENQVRGFEDDMVEVRRDEIEQPSDDVGIERAHFRGPIGCSHNGQAGRVVREHHFQELPIETLGSPLDLAEIETRLEVEVVSAGAVLEIEIDQAGG